MRATIEDITSQDMQHYQAIGYGSYNVVFRDPHNKWVFKVPMANCCDLFVLNNAEDPPPKDRVCIYVFHRWSKTLFYTEGDQRTAIVPVKNFTPLSRAIDEETRRGRPHNQIRLTAIQVKTLITDQSPGWEHNLLEKDDSSDPTRAVTLCQEINPNLPARTLTLENALQLELPWGQLWTFPAGTVGWLMPYLPGAISREEDDAKVAMRIIALYERTGRVALDACSPSNLKKDAAGDIHFIDIDLFVLRAAIPAARRRSVVSDKIWHTRGVSFPSYWDSWSHHLPLTTIVIRTLMQWNDYYSPESPESLKSRIPQDLLESVRCILQVIDINYKEHQLKVDPQLFGGWIALLFERKEMGDDVLNVGNVLWNLFAYGIKDIAAYRLIIDSAVKRNFIINIDSFAVSYYQLLMGDLAGTRSMDSLIKGAIEQIISKPDSLVSETLALYFTNEFTRVLLTDSSHGLLRHDIWTAFEMYILRPLKLVYLMEQSSIVCEHDPVVIPKDTGVAGLYFFARQTQSQADVSLDQPSVLDQPGI